jgi:NAD+ kinase
MHNMIIALFPNVIKKQSYDIANSIREFLSLQGVTVAVEDGETERVSAVPLSTIDPKDVSFVISLGGDGTLLRLIHKHPELEAPLLGINLGSLGFMADIPISNIYPSLQNLLDGNYSIQNRIMMEGLTANNESCLAVNEIVIHRAHNPCLIDLAIYVDGSYLNTFSADGVIASTPSGSTAYSLAAGGPILTPELEAFALTPISPHTISNRPIVLMPQREIRVEYISAHAPVEITYDGFPRFAMATGEVLRIQRSQRRFRLVSLPGHDYFLTLRTKLGWAGKLKS